MLVRAVPAGKGRKGEHDAPLFVRAHRKKEEKGEDEKRVRPAP